MPRRALVLSGGGAKGSFQLGVLEELIVNRGLDFEILCGISVGALNASFLAQAPFLADDAGQSLDHLRAALSGLREIWLDEIKGSGSIYRRRLGDRLGILLGADSIYDPTPVRELLQRRLSPAALAASGRTLCVQYVSLETGVLHATAASDEAHIVDHVMASATMPYYFPPVHSAGQHLVDGGVREITPLSQAFAAGAQAVYVVHASPEQMAPHAFVENILGTRVKAFDFLGRAIEIMADEIQRTDTAEARRLNAVRWRWDELRGLLAQRKAEPPDEALEAAVLRVEETVAGVSYAPIIEVRPQRHIIRDALDFAPAGIQESYRHGLEVAKKLGETP